jgi:N-terminal domain of anti-restriction factor ArdC
MTAKEIQQEALSRAANGRALSNYPAIFEGFMERGIPEADIRPRENIFTFQAWKALGRFVKKGEHGVKVVTWINREKKDSDGNVIDTVKLCKRTTVFHVSQTEGRA